MPKSLVRELQETAAKRLKTIRGVPKHMADRVELLVMAFGRAEILADFEKWCEENADRNPQWPVTDYLRIADSRLSARPSIDPHDERINQLQSITYELTDVLPRAQGVREALAIQSAEDIEAALNEYWLLNEGALKTIGGRQTLIREFFEDGGVHAVISARNRRLNGNGPARS